MSDQPNVAVPAHVVNRIHHKFWTYLLFWSVVAGSALIVPGYGLVYGYSWLDWTMFGILYVISGLGITVGYHRLLTHRSFECPDWVKGALLIAGVGTPELRPQVGSRPSPSPRPLRSCR